MGVITGAVGSARTYTSIAAWDAFVPSNLVTDGNSYVGSLYNDSEFVGPVTLGAHTTDATHTYTLTAAAGQSFQDAAGVRTNALRYNQANGVALRNATSWVSGFTSVGITYLYISRLQFKGTVASPAITVTCSGYIKDCLVEQTSNGYALSVNGPTLENLAVIMNNTYATGAIYCQFTNNLVLACTVVRTSNNAVGGTALLKYYSTPIVKSTAIFGFTTPVGTGWDAVNSKDNATDQAAGLPGSGNQYSVTYGSASPFVASNAGSGAHDFRTVTGTALSANGYLDAGNAPNDISNESRPSTPTIGAWELVGGAPPPTVHVTSIFGT